MALNDLSDADLTQLYGARAPHTPQDAAELLDRYGGSWWVVGGWAAQAFTGVTRPHEDVERFSKEFLQLWLRRNALRQTGTTPHGVGSLSTSAGC